jgi:folate-binding protein YgfZ
MNSQWKSFLDQHSDSSSPKHGQNNNLECMLIDLSHLGLIRVSGGDTRDFLQGQFTNDVRDVSDSHFQINSYCTPKGRILASFLLFERRGDLYLQLPRDTHQAVLKRLPMFVLMSKVKVEDADAGLIRIGLAGACAETLLGESLPTLPTGVDDQRQDGGITVLRLAGKTARYELIGEVKEITALWKTLSRTATIGNAGQWALLDIRAGIPTIQKGTIEAFVPQMVNLQLIDGVSFTKGCYTGQEVVARMKYLGKLKRRMFLAHVDTETPPRPGDELFSSCSQSGQGAGKVVDAQHAPEGGYDLLAVAEISLAKAGDLHLLDTGGPGLQLMELPYSVREQEPRENSS